MGRVPCRESKRLKKGPWTAEEDLILIAHIQKHGHPNWRQLPKQAGLLRCGKSCRLRWTNYLRPDIKRGNFSQEEEETIINLHEMFGNRWSAIAAKLPGRTDNEIKNVWHTNLKKRVVKQISDEKQNTETINEFAESAMSCPQPRSSDVSSVVTTITGETNHQCKDEQIDLFDNFPEIHESFWTADALTENPSSSIIASDFGEAINEFQSDDDMTFWYNILLKTADELQF